MTRHLFSRNHFTRRRFPHLVAAMPFLAAVFLIFASAQPSAADITFNPGDDIAAMINNAPNGTTFNFGGGTYTLSATIQAQVNDVFKGNPDALNPTIFEGRVNGRYTDRSCIISNGCYSVQMSNIVIQHYIDLSMTKPSDSPTALRTGPNWTLTNVCVQQCGYTGVDLQPGVIMTGGGVKYCGHLGISVSGSGVTLNNVEIAYNDTINNSQTGTYADASGLKGSGVDNVKIMNCDVHDNQCNGLWADIDCHGWYILDNFVKNNSGDGILYEISHSGTIYNNLVVNNGGAGGADQILISNSDTTNAYLNTVVANANQNAIILQSDGNRPGAVKLSGNGLRSNNVTFTSPGCIYGLLTNVNSTNMGTGNYSITNNFHANYTPNPSSAAADFYWGSYAGSSPVLQTLTAFQQGTGQDPGSTISQW